MDLGEVLAHLRRCRRSQHRLRLQRRWFRRAQKLQGINRIPFSSKPPRIRPRGSDRDGRRRWLRERGGGGGGGGGVGVKSKTTTGRPPPPLLSLSLCVSGEVVLRRRRLSGTRSRRRRDFPGTGGLMGAAFLLVRANPAYVYPFFHVTPLQNPILYLWCYRVRYSLRPTISYFGCV